MRQAGHKPGGKKEDMKMVHFDTYDEAAENCRGDEVVVRLTAAGLLCP